MFDQLLSAYERERDYLRRLGAEFAEAHPKIAGRLRLSGDVVEDPHVSRLLDGVAFLTARIQRRLDDDFPELTDALLGTLYPHYVSPVPSMAIVQFAPQSDLAGPYPIASGTEIDTEPVAGEACRYRTAYPVTLWPIEIRHISLANRPVAAPPNARAAQAVAVLRIVLQCSASDMTFAQLGPDRIRFYLRGGGQRASGLYELLTNNTVSVALADSPADPTPVILGPEAVRSVGFGLDEGLLPYPAQSFLGYRLLTEFFCFPEKFLFFDIVGLGGKVLLDAGNRLEIFLYLDRNPGDLESGVSTESLALGCTPVVNLFPQRAEPIEASETSTEYRLVPDARRLSATEIHSIIDVRATAANGEVIPFAPFFAAKHAGNRAKGKKAYWHAVRRPRSPADPGTDMFLSFVDPDFDPAGPADAVISVETLCLNRDLPGRLPFGGGRPYLTLVEGNPLVHSVICLTPPTPTFRPSLGRGGRWRLVSHLLLNHLSLTDNEAGVEALREILTLYDFRDMPETAAMIGAIAQIRCQPGVARAPEGNGAFCRGLDVNLELDPAGFSGGGLFLMAAVLDRFFGLYCSINTFTRLTTTIKGRTGVLRRWPPRAGSRTLL